MFIQNSLHCYNLGRSLVATNRVLAFLHGLLRGTAPTLSNGSLAWLDVRIPKTSSLYITCYTTKAAKKANVTTSPLVLIGFFDWP